MKKYNPTEIEDIALRYAYKKKSLTQKNVDRQAEKIVGADLLRENRGGIWSCARAFGDSCYIVLFDKSISIFPDIVCNEHVCVPCVLNYTE